LNNLPTPANVLWKEDPDIHPTPPNFKTKPEKMDKPADILKEFIPDHTAQSCERFHINFWFGHYPGTGGVNPPPSSRQEVIITNFEFQP
jgi:hypothetical protein